MVSAADATIAVSTMNWLCFWMSGVKPAHGLLGSFLVVLLLVLSGSLSFSALALELTLSDWETRQLVPARVRLRDGRGKDYVTPVRLKSRLARSAGSSWMDS